MNTEYEHTRVMIVRRTLCGAFILGLAFSICLWGLSYFGISQQGGSLTVRFGSVFWIRHASTDGASSDTGMASPFGSTTAKPRPGDWFLYGFDGMHTRWLPEYVSLPGYLKIVVPLWIPTLMFAGMSCLVCRSFYQYSKRQKQGRCTQCGYMLYGLTEPRCPECGAVFDLTRSTHLETLDT